jgi:hypothetical protein
MVIVFFLILEMVVVKDAYCNADTDTQHNNNNLAFCPKQVGVG